MPPSECYGTDGSLDSGLVHTSMTKALTTVTRADDHPPRQHHAPPIPNASQCPCGGTWATQSHPAGFLVPEKNCSQTLVYTLSRIYPVTIYARVCSNYRAARGQGTQDGGAEEGGGGGCVLYWTGYNEKLHRQTTLTIIAHEMFHMTWDILVGCDWPGIESAHAVINKLGTANGWDRDFVNVQTFSSSLYGFFTRQEEEYRVPCTHCEPVWVELPDGSFEKANGCTNLGFDAMELKVPLQAKHGLQYYDPIPGAPKVWYI